MKNLRVTIIQPDLVWENPVANLQAFEGKMDGLEGKTDLIILPEMFPTGFSMNSEKLAEQMNGPAVTWMARMASKIGAVVTGSLIIADAGRYYNRLVWMHPTGEYKTYDKRHLFRMSSEQEHFSAGSSRVVCEVNGWRVFPLICYDLRFPVWSRNNLNFDLLVYVANWPSPRVEAWRKLLMARAIENQCYVAGVNRVGKDGNGFDYSGQSLIVDSKGMLLHDHGDAEEFVATVQLDGKELLEFREKFPVGLDADKFNLL